MIKKKTKKKPATIVIDCSRINYELLRIQKRSLIHLLNDQRAVLRPGQFDHLAVEGLVNLLDFIQDKAADVLSERKVFGKPEVA